MPVQIPPSVVPLFLAAGWHANRRAALPDDFDPVAFQGHPAVQILESLSGLCVGRCDVGLECATSDIEFGYLQARETSVAWWERALSTQLIEVAQFAHGHGALFVAADGRCFALSHIHDLFTFVGESFEVAVDRLLRGLRDRPKLRADQVAVTAYGIEYTRDSPEVYDYRQGPSN